ncbi:hypothetical protein M409DRAFT_29494 [Zasmidium cellare ATCC 36951]|uniref:Uncharacterized protein n=1 Tax=Zasmidium cellare ATCC 36951 TaxID=1080233 RepID=A0A6A6C2G2_ZASCE|nr:uncharacterized protein M409DRAFT_29494 [Zasmidium cellare ATCC 36951]KAF2160042.1 hypothetical protein M409DRAFT_29494 [Zasmidium cellare ATCC 36951]
MPAALRPRRASRKPAPPPAQPPRPRPSKRQPPPFDRDQYEMDCEDWLQQARLASKLADERIRKRDEREQRMQQRAAQRPKKKQRDTEQEDNKVEMAATTANTPAPATRVVSEAQADDEDPTSPQAQEQPDDPEAEARRCQVRQLWGHEHGERSSSRESQREPDPPCSREASVEFVASRPLCYTTNQIATACSASQSTVLTPRLVDTAMPILSSSLCESQAMSSPVTSGLALQTPNPHPSQDSRLWSCSIHPPHPQQPLHPQVQNPAFVAPSHSNPPPPTLPLRQGFIPPLNGYMQTFEIGDNGMFYACAGPLQRPQPSVQRRIDISAPSDAVRHRRLPGLQVKRSAWPRAISDPPPDRLILFGKSMPVSKSSMPSVQARGLTHHFTTSS